MMGRSCEGWEGGSQGLPHVRLSAGLAAAGEPAGGGLKWD